MLRNPLACRISSYEPYESDAFAHLASIGVGCVEILVPEPAQIAATRAALAAHGLRATTMHGQCDVACADLAAQIQAQMPAFEALGCTIFFAAVQARDTPLPTVYDRLRAAGDVTARYGITIALETHPDLVTNGDVAVRTLGGVNHPNVRINFDTANVHFYNHNVDTVTELRKVMSHVASIHLKDTDCGYRHWHFPALGRGAVPLPGVLKLVEEAGFAGPLTIEIEGIEGESKTRELVLGRVQESVDFLRRHGVG